MIGAAERIVTTFAYPAGGTSTSFATVSATTLPCGAASPPVGDCDSTTLSMPLVTSCRVTNVMRPASRMRVTASMRTTPSTFGTMTFGGGGG